MTNITETLLLAWCAETAADGRFDRCCPSRGQCAVTALVVQDWLGGVLLRAVTPLGSHYWNCIPLVGEIDLTRDQFPFQMEIPRGEHVPRSRLTDGDAALAARTVERYELLKIRIARAQP